MYRFATAVARIEVDIECTVGGWVIYKNCVPYRVEKQNTAKVLFHKMYVFFYLEKSKDRFLFLLSPCWSPPPLFFDIMLFSCLLCASSWIILSTNSWNKKHISYWSQYYLFNEPLFIQKFTVKGTYLFRKRIRFLVRSSFFRSILDLFCDYPSVLHLKFNTKTFLEPGTEHPWRLKGKQTFY